MNFKEHIMKRNMTILATIFQWTKILTKYLRNGLLNMI